MTNEILLQPRDLILPSGKRFSFEYDHTGLATIRLPGGSGLIGISTQAGMLGVEKIILRLPGLTEPFITYWAAGTNLLQQIRTPSGDGNVAHKYNALGLLLKTASGDSLSLYQYNEDNLLTRVTHNQEDAFTLKSTFVRKFQPNQASSGTQLLEMRHNFDARSRLASAKFDYVVADNLIDLVMEGRIGAKNLPLYYVHHGWTSLGTSRLFQASKSSGHFLIHPHNLNVSTVTDGVATFTFGGNFDALTVQGRELYRAEHELDSCGKIGTSQLKMVKGNAEFKQTWQYLYDDDGQLESASILDNTQWRYAYDLWGNLLSVVTSGQPAMVKLNFEYDGNGLLKGSAFFASHLKMHLLGGSPARPC